MTDALQVLEEWVRKHYHFRIECGSNCQPGDGYWVELKSPIRKVGVSDCELATEDEDGDLIYPSLSVVILEALSRWHADTRLKLYHVVTHEKGEFPAGLVQEIMFQSDTGHSCVKVVARTEQEVQAKFLVAYGGNPPTIRCTERELLEQT